MIFQNDELYPLYIAYVERKNLNPGALRLSKISESLFLDFKYQYTNSPGFKYKQDNLYKSVVRDINIDRILDTDSIDDFLNNI
jgi:hypothetical protein